MDGMTLFCKPTYSFLIGFLDMPHVSMPMLGFLKYWRVSLLSPFLPCPFLAKDDAIISDELNHASIIDGIRLSKARRALYKHLDLGDLETKLIETQGVLPAVSIKFLDCRRRMIVTDGVFSMDGDVAPLKEIFSLAEKYNAFVFMDECHATGFLGPTGRGTEEMLGRDILRSFWNF